MLSKLAFALINTALIEVESEQKDLAESRSANYA